MGPPTGSLTHATDTRPVSPLEQIAYNPRMGLLGAPRGKVRGGSLTEKQMIGWAEVRQPCTPTLTGQMTSPLGACVLSSGTRRPQTHLRGLLTGWSHKGRGATSEQLEWENLTIASVDAEVEQPELSDIAGGDAKGCSRLGTAGKPFDLAIPSQVPILSDHVCVHSSTLVINKNGKLPKMPVND